MMNSLNDFRTEVIETLCELGGYCEEDALILSEEKLSDIEYGHKYRLSPAIIAGSILGINDCCVPTRPPKS